MPPITEIFREFHMQQFLLKALNQSFRPTKPVEVSLFPGHEFDENEAIKLKGFGDLLQSAGYDEIFKQKDSSKFKDILDLAAGYGCFVQKEASPWYLGIFIVAESVMEPYSDESFYNQMLRSSVFVAASDEYKNLSLWLMLMAFFCDRLDTTPRRVELFVASCSELGYHLKNLPLESFLQLKAIGAQ
jgi:hypothetical protein